jgi:general stress protein 26
MHCLETHLEGVYIMNLTDKILEVIRGTKLASVATIMEESDQILPAVRYMLATGYEDLTLSAFTKIDTRKIAQIEKNPNVALMIASEGAPTRPYVAIRAIAKIYKEPEIKRKYWGTHLKKFIKSPEDPEYVAISFIPSKIEYYSRGKMEVLQLEGQ